MFNRYDAVSLTQTSTVVRIPSPTLCPSPPFARPDPEKNKNNNQL